MAERKRCSCGQVHEPGVMVEFVGGPRDGERHDYALGNPETLACGRYVLDRGWGERRGQRREYVYRWEPKERAS